MLHLYNIIYSHAYTLHIDILCTYRISSAKGGEENHDKN